MTISYVSDASPYKHILRYAQLLVKRSNLDEQSQVHGRHCSLKEGRASVFVKIQAQMLAIK